MSIRSLARALTLLPVSLLLLPPPVQAQDLSLCEGSYEARGETRLLLSTTVADQQHSLLSGPAGQVAGKCSTKMLPAGTGAIAWAGILPKTPDGNSIILQGNFDTNATEVSEVILPTAANPAQIDTASSYLLAGEELLSAFTPRSFGREARAALAEGTVLQCTAGIATAGLMFQTRQRWPMGSQALLEIQARGKGSFTLALSDPGRERRETALALGGFTLNDGQNLQTLQFTIPANRSNWSSLTVLCPKHSASIQISSLRLVPASSRQIVRAAWFWSPQLWQSRAETLLRSAAESGLNRLYLTIPLHEGPGAEQIQSLSTFLEEAHQRGIEVWAVLGDRDDVRPENLELALARARTLLAFNAQQPEQARIDGLQLDVEPYLLPGFGADEEYWQRRYLELMNAVGDLLADKLPLDLVMPVWWATQPLWGKALLDGITAPFSITVMNYRTDRFQLKTGARPFFEWGSAHNVPVHIALETGTLPDELRKHFYVDDNRGELWLINVGRHPVLLLLQQAAADLPGRAYKLAFETSFKASNLSFRQHDPQLDALLRQLAFDWSIWPAFSGLALHGLEEDLQQESAE